MRQVDLRPFACAATRLCVKKCYHCVTNDLACCRCTCPTIASPIRGLLLCCAAFQPPHSSRPARAIPPSSQPSSRILQAARQRCSSPTAGAAADSPLGPYLWACLPPLQTPCHPRSPLLHPPPAPSPPSYLLPSNLPACCSRPPKVSRGGPSALMQLRGLMTPSRPLSASWERHPWGQAYPHPTRLLCRTRPAPPVQASRRSRQLSRPRHPKASLAGRWARATQG